jgi:signal recognition particle receptor subunit beta
MNTTPIVHRILFTGTMGVGKSTAVASLLDAPLVSTAIDGGRAPVAVDHGDIVLDNGDRLRLYGTPGQRRFEPTWRALAEDAMGLVVLVDHARPDPLADLVIYLENFAGLIARTGCVIGVGRLRPGTPPSLDALAEAAARHGVVCPIVPLDVRERAQVLARVDLLLVQLESRGS